jgi:hypothetical protein
MFLGTALPTMASLTIPKENIDLGKFSLLIYDLNASVGLITKNFHQKMRDFPVR